MEEKMGVSADQRLTERNVLTLNVRGKITTITRDGRSAIVLLDEPYQGLKYAVINPDCRGRVALMNRSNGVLIADTKVCVLRAHRGPEALAAMEIEYAGE